MKIKKSGTIPAAQLNLSIHRAVLDTTQDFLSALIVEFIHFRFVQNDRKPVWLKIDWIHEELPFISRSGLAKKLKKLIKDGDIIVRKGEGRHYHKIWFSLSSYMLEAFSDASIQFRSGKVYYNVELAAQNLEASVVYAAIVNLLRMVEGPQEKAREGKLIIGREYGRVGDELLLDYAKLAEGSGLSINKVRKAVRWLIEKKKIEARKVFGNKRRVKLPADTIPKPGDLKSYSGELPTESYPHSSAEEDPT